MQKHQRLREGMTTAVNTYYIFACLSRKKTIFTAYLYLSLYVQTCSNVFIGTDQDTADGGVSAEHPTSSAVPAVLSGPGASVSRSVLSHWSDYTDRRRHAHPPHKQNGRRVRRRSNRAARRRSGFPCDACPLTGAVGMSAIRRHALFIFRTNEPTSCAGRRRTSPCQTLAGYDTGGGGGGGGCSD